MIAKDKMNGFYNSVVRFNALADKDNPFVDDTDFKITINDQVKRILEEMDEVVESLEQNDNVELLDGVVDLLYVVMGAARNLENAGFDVGGALMEVAENNLSKFTTSYAEAASTVEHYGSDKVYMCKTEMNGITYYGVKRISDNKLMKPKTYVAVDLSKFVPEVI